MASSELLINNVDCFYKNRYLASSIIGGLKLYNHQEQSFQRRVDTIQKIQTILKRLLQEEWAAKSFFQKILYYFGVGLSDAERISACANQCLPSRWSLFKRKCLEARVQGIVRKSLAMGNELEKRVKECAFRLLKFPSGEARVWRDCLMQSDPNLFGSTPEVSAQKLAADVERFLEQSKSYLSAQDIEKVREAKRQVDRFAGWAATCSALSEMVSSDSRVVCMVHDLIYDIQKSISNLKVGETVLIPGGFRDAINGHAVTYGLTRTSEAAYELFVINTGEGAFYGQEDGEHLSRGKVKRLCYGALSLETAKEEKLWEELLHPYIVRSKERLSMKPIYQKLENRLFRQGDVCRLLREEYLLQTWDICPHVSSVSALKQILSPRLFHLFLCSMTASAKEEFDCLLSDVERAGVISPLAIYEINRSGDAHLREVFEEARAVLERSSLIAQERQLLQALAPRISSAICTAFSAAPLRS